MERKLGAFLIAENELLWSRDVFGVKFMELDSFSGVESLGVFSGVSWDAVWFHHMSSSSLGPELSAFTGLSLSGVMLSRFTGENGTLKPNLSGLNRKLCLLAGDVILW